MNNKHKIYRRRYTFIWMVLPFIFFLFPACEKTYELEIPEGFPVPIYPKDNALSAARVALGKKLFYDPLLSRDSSISCNSCHKQEFAFTDPKPISPGVENRLGKRNAMSLVNVAYGKMMNRDGGVPKLDLQAIVPIETEEEMDFSAQEIAERLNQMPDYQKLFKKAYDREADAFTITRALGAFQRTLISGNSPYDQYEFQGIAHALNAQELRGKALFFSDRLNCTTCHSGFNFSAGTFANNGLYENYKDNGRRDVTLAEADIGHFKIPTLRNIELTAPYMHDGSLSTLEAVIEHYDSGGKAHPNKNEVIQPLHLSNEEKQDLIAFLKSLTDQRFIENPAFR